MPLTFRHQEILTAAQDSGRVTVEDLADRFAVTRQTIRRDLTDLCNAGLLSRVHGGAVLTSGLTMLGYHDRRAQANDAKNEIGRRVAADIPNGSAVFLDIGTTTEAVARALLDHRDLMVVTNNLNMPPILAQNHNCELLIAGGQYRASDNSVVGDATAEFIRQFRVDFAVIGASALDEDGTLMDHDYREVRVTRSIIDNARMTFLAVDNSKFERKAPVRVCSVTEVAKVFTDLPMPNRFREICQQAAIEISLPPDA